MDEPQRPFGLTLLTGLNLGIALLNVSAAIQLGYALSVARGMTTGLDAPIAIAFGALPRWFLLVELVAAVIKIPLLVVAGLGYYTFRRSSRWVGTGYAAVSLAETGLAAALYGLSGGAMISCLYPIFTLLAVHGVFKERLVR